MSYIPAQAVREAEADVGFHEGPNNSNPYSEWQYGNRYNPYCNSATCKWSYDAGFRFWSNCTYGVKGEAYTPTYSQKAKDHGVWREKWWRAKPGDDVEYDWGNNGLIDHVEKVVADDGTTIITVGANTSDGVYYRRRDRRYVAGFVALSEAGQSAPTPIPPSIPQEYEDMIIRAPQRQQGPVLSRPATVRLDIAGKRIVRMNGCKVSQPDAIPASTRITGWFETFKADGSKKGFIVMADKLPDGFPAFEFTWPA